MENKIEMQSKIKELISEIGIKCKVKEYETWFSDKS